MRIMELERVPAPDVRDQFGGRGVNGGDANAEQQG